MTSLRACSFYLATQLEVNTTVEFLRNEERKRLLSLPGVTAAEVDEFLYLVKLQTDGKIFKPITEEQKERRRRIGELSKKLYPPPVQE